MSSRSNARWGARYACSIPGATGAAPASRDARAGSGQRGRRPRSTTTGDAHMESGGRPLPHFQEELSALKERVLAMGGLAEDAVRRAVAGLAQRDLEAIGRG